MSLASHSHLQIYDSSALMKKPELVLSNRIRIALFQIILVQVPRYSRKPFRENHIVVHTWMPTMCHLVILFNWDIRLGNTPFTASCYFSEFRPPAPAHATQLSRDLPSQPTYLCWRG